MSSTYTFRVEARGRFNGLGMLEARLKVVIANAPESTSLRRFR